MKYFSQKQWFLAWITGATLVLFIAGVTQAQKQPQQERSPSSPLPRNHPDAQLDPNLLNTPPMPEPQQERSLPLPRNHPDAQLDPNLLNTPPMPEPRENIPNIFSTEIPLREISYDIRTGSTRISIIRPAHRKASPSISSPNIGADFNIESEPNADSP